MTNPDSDPVSEGSIFRHRNFVSLLDRSQINNLRGVSLSLHENHKSWGPTNFWKKSPGFESKPRTKMRSYFRLLVRQGYEFPVAPPEVEDP